MTQKRAKGEKFNKNLCQILKFLVNQMNFDIPFRKVILLQRQLYPADLVCSLTLEIRQRQRQRHHENNPLSSSVEGYRNERMTKSEKANE